MPEKIAPTDSGSNATVDEKKAKGRTKRIFGLGVSKGASHTAPGGAAEDGKSQKDLPKTKENFWQRKGERHSLWWFLQPRHVEGRNDEKSSRHLPPKKLALLQPVWRQSKIEKGALGFFNSFFHKLSSLIYFVVQSMATIYLKFIRKLKECFATAPRESEKKEAAEGGEQHDETLEGDSSDEEGEERNIFESSEALDADGVPRFPPNILNPRSLGMLYWNLTITLLVFFNLCFCPFRFGFETMQLEIRKVAKLQNWGIWNSYLLWMEYIVDAFFCLDVLIQLHTAYFKEQNGEIRLIVAQTPVFMHNIRKWLIIDVGVGFPYEFLFNYKYHFGFEGGEQQKDPKFWYTIIRFARFLKFLKFKDWFRISRVGNLDVHITRIKERLALQTGAVRVANFFLAFLYSLHFCACMLFAVARRFDEVLQDSWMNTVGMVATSVIQTENGTLRPYSSKRATSSIELPINRQYLASLYYMTTTLTQVGYGDFVPVSVYEMILLTFTMIVGGGMFSYIVGNAEQLFLDFQGIDVEAQNKIEEITRLVFEVSDIDAFIDNARFISELFFFCFRRKSPRRFEQK